jgi:outer membrane lipopolysaccharide assembly protein LptE/RlpB
VFNEERDMKRIAFLAMFAMIFTLSSCGWMLEEANIGLPVIFGSSGYN